MLNTSIDAYLALRRAVGFRLEDVEYLLRSFARWAAERDETHVRSRTAIAWAAATRSVWRREMRLRVVAAFARHALAEDSRHEVPPIFMFAHHFSRPTPRLYTSEEVRRLMDAAGRLPATYPLKPHVASTLFGLLASTGLRLSEALALQLRDVTRDGLVIRKTKFNKTRLVPLHPSVVVALDRYLDLRKGVLESDYVLPSCRGGRLSRKTVGTWFRRLMRKSGLHSGPGTRRLRIHDLRHTFAVGALEASPGGPSAVSRHGLALSTYLGHASVAATYWYLQATPRLMRGVADACEQFVETGEPRVA